MNIRSHFGSSNAFAAVFTPLDDLPAALVCAISTYASSQVPDLFTTMEMEAAPFVSNESSDDTFVMAKALIHTRALPVKVVNLALALVAVIIVCRHLMDDEVTVVNLVFPLIFGYTQLMVTLYVSIAQSTANSDVFDRLWTQFHPRTHQVEPKVFGRSHSYGVFIGMLVLQCISGARCYMLCATNNLESMYIWTTGFHWWSILDLFLLMEAFALQLYLVIRSGADFVHLSCLDLSQRSIGEVIDKIRAAKNKEDAWWVVITKAHMKLDTDLEELFRPSHFGGMVITCSMVFLGPSILYIVVGLMSEGMSMRPLILAGGGLIITGLLVIYVCCVPITDRCNNPHNESGSIVDVASSYRPSTGETYKEFMAYMASSTIGAEICGVLVDQALFIAIVQGILTKGAPAIFIASEFLRKKTA